MAKSPVLKNYCVIFHYDKELYYDLNQYDISFNSIYSKNNEKMASDVINCYGIENGMVYVYNVKAFTMTEAQIKVFRDLLSKNMNENYFQKNKYIFGFRGFLFLATLLFTNLNKEDYQYYIEDLNFEETDINKIYLLLENWFLKYEEICPRYKKTKLAYNTKLFKIDDMYDETDRNLFYSLSDQTLKELIILSYVPNSFTLPITDNLE